MKSRAVVAVRLLFAVSCVQVTIASPKIPTGEKDPQFWHDKAKKDLNRRLYNYKEINSIAKNVILFIGDGLGQNTITAARILKGQLNNMPGEETEFIFDKWPNIGLSKTYNVDRQTGDSAGTATAMMSGVKTNYFVVGLNAHALASDCPGQHGKNVDTILDWANAANKRTGIVTTARITHATPAAAYAHSSDRYWEGDVDLEGVEGGCRDIAQQLVDDNKDINVILGGGRRVFLPNDTADPETNDIGSKHRRDGRNLIKEWEDDKKDRSGNYKYVWNKDGFDEVDPRYTDYLLGLFEPNHMQYELDRDKSGPTGEPSLPEMVRKAIQILQRDVKGYFLMVEAARIDHGHHDSKAKKALHETLMLEEAVRQTMQLVDIEDTLVIVTGDHSHPFNLAGYQYRGSDIFGLVQPVDPTEDTSDGKPYSVLIYGNGPGYSEPRADLRNVDMHDKDFIYPGAVPMPWDTHGGEDVSIFAIGPMAHLIHSTHEQNYIAHVMAYSACIGPYFGDCDRPEEPTSSGVQPCVSILLVLLASVIKCLS